MVGETRAKPQWERRARPRSVEELTERNVETIVAIEDAAKKERTTSDHVVDAVTAFCGTMSFVWLHVIWFGVWILANTLPMIPHFDKFPFTLLTTIVSLEAIILSTFILITENRQAKISERRNHLDLQVNLLTEQENTKILSLLRRIADKVGVDYDDDPDVAVLEESTRPEKLIEQIDRCVERQEMEEDIAEAKANAGF
jgi:uncharacterized membrane protein